MTNLEADRESDMWVYHSETSYLIKDLIAPFSIAEINLHLLHAFI